MAQNFNIKEMARIALFAALISMLALVIIPLPFSPVPVSGQSLGVMLAGLFLKPKAAVMSILIYIFMGVIGLPVFSGGTSGPGILLGPTGGYIWGFVIGVYLISLLIGKNTYDTIFWQIAALITGGIIIIYVLGLIQYMIVTGTNFYQALTAAVIPFLPGDIFKVIIALIIKRKFAQINPANFNI